MITLILSILIFAAGGESTSEFDSFLKKKFSEYKKYEYEVVSLPSTIKSVNDERISINADREFRINYGFAYIPVDIKYSNENITQSFVTIRMNLFNEVLVANRKIKKGEIISSADFSYKIEEITHLRYSTVNNFTELKNQQAAMNISDGSILQNNMIESIPDIKAGDKVFAFSTLGSVIVSFPVSVREDGRIGETVRVVRDDKLTFKALVVSSEQVKIIE